MNDEPFSLKVWLWHFFHGYFGLRYLVIRRSDADHALLAGEFADEEKRDDVVSKKMAPHWHWRWRWQRPDGSPRWR